MPIGYLDKIVPMGTPRWLMGQTLHTPEKERFAGYRGKGLSWGVVDQSQLAAIDTLELWPDDSSTTRVPPVIASLPHLKTLIMPSWFVPALRAADLPNSLEALLVGVGGENKPRVKWDRSLVLPGIRMLDLGRVQSDFYAGTFPGLNKTLTITAGNKKLSLAEIGQCQQLTNLFLHKAATIADINAAGAPALRFAAWMEAKNEDFTGLAGYGQLHDAEIKWNKQLVSLRGLEQLPALQRLEIASCPQLTDLGKIAEISSLQWLRIMDCGRQWAAGGERIREKFAQAGFEKIRFEPEGRHTLLEVWRKSPEQGA